MSTETPEIRRGPGRPPNPRSEMRPEAEDSRARAAKRAAQIRENLGGALDEGEDDFAIDKSSIPDGWCYEWKMETVLGKEDPTYQVGLRRKGWEPVPASRHPGMMPDGSKDTCIRRKGMVLMERPMELTEEARGLERKRARDQVRQKEEQLTGAPQGHFERANKDAPMVKIKHSYEPTNIPE